VEPSISSLLLGSIFAGTGVLFIMAAIFKWGWFACLWKVRTTYEAFGNVGGTVFFVIVGLTAVAVGVLLAMRIL